MNGIATTLAVAILRDDGADEIADELVAEYRALEAERDHARALAAHYGELLWLEQTQGSTGLVPVS